MRSARSKRAQNKKHYIENIKELKAKAKENYKSNPEEKKGSITHLFKHAVWH